MRNALKTLTEICRESVRDALFSNPDDSSNLIAGQSPTIRRLTAEPYNGWKRTE